MDKKLINILWLKFHVGFCHTKYAFDITLKIFVWEQNKHDMNIFMIDLQQEPGSDSY
jgi:hypothetical protein